MTVVTTSQNIIDAAVKSSISNDAANTAVANDTTEVLKVINRLVQRVYAVAAMPPEKGGMSRGDFFSTSGTITINSASPPTVPAAAFRHVFTDAAGDEVKVVSRRDVVRGFAELPPAVVIEQDAVRSAGRTGDPVDTDVLTVYYTPLPEAHDAATEFIGATTAATATTSRWPEHVGNPWLIAKLREYFAIKRGDADQGELQDIAREIQETALVLADFIGIDATYLTTSESD